MLCAQVVGVKMGLAAGKRELGMMMSLMTMVSRTAKHERRRHRDADDTLATMMTMITIALQRRQTGVF